MVAPVFITFLRGLAFLSPAIVFGVLVARYVPSAIIGWCTLALAVVVCYMAGAIIRPMENWSWRKRKRK